MYIHSCAVPKREIRSQIVVFNPASLSTGGELRGYGTKAVLDACEEATSALVPFFL